MARLQAWGDLFFDVFSTSLSFVDLISDVFVSVQFYQEGEYVCFWVSMCIFFMAQCAYVAQFEIQFGRSSDRDCKRALRCLLVFPVAQFVPLLVWLATAEKKWVLRLLISFNLNAHQSSPPVATADPLQQYLSKKWREHIGFIIEAVVEAVPQSLLQMAYIVARGKATPLNVFSIASSLLTVCSKGFLFTYSIYPLMVIFGACCFCADVTGVFATVSFLTMPYTSPSSTSYSLFGIETLNLASYLWMIKELTLFFVMVCLGLIVCGAFSTEKSSSTSWCKHLLQMLGLLAGGITFFVPAAIFLEGIKLFAIPLIIFGEQLQSQRRSPQAARDVWNFIRGNMQGTSKLLKKFCDEETRSFIEPSQGWFDVPDFEKKMRALNLAAAQGCLDDCRGRCQVQGRWDRKYWLVKCRLAFRVRRSCVFTKGDEGQGGVGFLWHQYKHIILGEIETAKDAGTPKAWGALFLVVGVFGFLIPIYVLGNLYSLFYPLICMLTLEMGLLQKVFGGMYVFFLLATLLTGCLSHNFLRFLLRVRYAVTHAHFFQGTNPTAALAPVLATYCMWRRQEAAYYCLHSRATYTTSHHSASKLLATEKRDVTLVNRSRSFRTKKSSIVGQLVRLKTGPMFPREVALLVLQYVVTQEAVYRLPPQWWAVPEGSNPQAPCLGPAPCLQIEC